MLIAPATFLALATRCAPEVAAGTLAAVAGAESGFNTLAIHDNTTHRNVAVRDKAGAIVIAARLIAAGHSVDLGLMQIDSGNLAGLGLTVRAAFDACASVRAAGRLLAADYRPGGKGRQAALLEALSRYNTGNAWRGFQNGYVRRVVVTARHVVPEIDPTDQVRSATPAAQNRQTLRPAAPAAAVSANHSHTQVSARAPSWDVFPDSIGPAGFARKQRDTPVTLSARRLSTATGSDQPSTQDPHGEKHTR